MKIFPACETTFYTLSEYAEKNDMAKMIVHNFKQNYDEILRLIGFEMSKENVMVNKFAYEEDTTYRRI